MTFHEIISRESQNEDSIYLYREGMFMRRMSGARSLPIR